MQRSARVSGKRPMVAMAFGHQEEKAKVVTPFWADGLAGWEPGLPGFIFGGGRLVNDADHEAGIAVVTGIEDAFEFVVASEEAVALIDQQCRPALLNDAKQGGRTDVGGEDGPVDQMTEQHEEGRFAATLGGGVNAHRGHRLWPCPTLWGSQNIGL